MSTDRFVFGATTTCTDGARGKVVGLVVGLSDRDGTEGTCDPGLRASSYVLRYIVVEPQHRIAMGRLVPVGMARPDERGVRLDCDLAGFEGLPMAERTRVTPGAERSSGIVGSWYSSIGVVADDVVPAGHVTLHGGAPVEGAGPDGTLLGIVVDRDKDGSLVDFLVTKKRSWGPRRVVAVPVTKPAATPAE
jgi:hypothetical protein